MTMRLSDASLDPYARVFMPTLSPYTAATGGGSVRVWGEVYTPDALHVEAAIDDLQVRLFDYELRNRGVLRVGLDGQVVRVDQFVLTGDRTALDVSGQVDLARDVVTLRANGEANLAVRAGRAARRARLGPGRGLGEHRRQHRRADPVGERAGHRRPAAFVRLSPRPGGDQRHRHLRRLRGAARRPARPPRRRHGDARRPARARRPGGDRLRRDAQRARPAAALSRGHALAGRRHARLAGPGRRRRCSADR